MKELTFVFVLLCGTCWAQPTVYANLDDSNAVDMGGTSSGWGSCTSCAGGQNENLAMIHTMDGVTTPSRDGDSRNFFINGPEYANGLWWYKTGPNDQVSNFTFDFWVQVDSGSLEAQAMEFDAFQFVGKQKYTFGTQCNYNQGFWDLWNEYLGEWMKSNIPCTKFTPGAWYHITMMFHHTPDTMEHYDLLEIVQYNSQNRIVAMHTYMPNAAYPSGPLPATWTENMGVQFQMDIGPHSAQMNEWVDLVSLTVR